MQLSFFKKCVTCGQQKLLIEFHKHSNSPDAVQYSCKKCTNEKTRRHHIANKEKIAEQSRIRYRNNHPPPTRLSESERKEHARIANQKYYDANKSKRVAATAASARKNPFTWIAKHNIRRAREASAVGEFTRDEFRALCERYDNKCLCCKQGKPLTADHVIPLSKGGSNSIENIQPLCRSCNCRKHSKTIDYR